jgi:hypothetical protein
MNRAMRAAALVAGGALGLLLACPGLAAEEAREVGGHRVKLAPGPSSATSMAVLGSPERLLLVDPAQRTVWQLGLDGQLQGRWSGKNLSAFDRHRPTQLVGDSLLLLGQARALVWHGSASLLTPPRALDLDQGADGRAYGLGPVLDLEWARGWVVGLASLWPPREGSARGAEGGVAWFAARFLGYGLGPPRRLREVSRPASGLHALGLQAVTSLPDGSVYFLDLTGPPQVQRVELGLAPRRVRVAGMPAGFERSIQADWSQREIAPALASLESQTGPVGLVSTAKGVLLVLTRRPLGPAGTGRTEWHLHPLDPATDRYRPGIRLPTEARHLLLARSLDGGLLLLEKGPAGAFLDQEIGDLVSLPASWLKSRGLP